MADILIVEDMANPRKALSILLKKQGYKVDEAANGSQALAKLDRTVFDLVITDLKMEPIDGMQVLKQTREKYPNTKVILVTAFGSIENSVDSMKLGAIDYITKPFKIDEMLSSVRMALGDHVTLQSPQFQVSSKYCPNIIGSSGAMQEVMELVSRISGTDSTVLITGDSGTGKELIAKTIHANSLRNNKPLITVNCGALPETLLESELFGHTRGAFTGAVKDRKGLFEEAEGGTIFLDEIGEISSQTQVKLLRVLQDGDIRRIGDNQSVQINTRILAATNKDLEKSVKEGRFREDLFYRLYVIPIKLPSLAERREDIPNLVEHFTRKFCNKLNISIPSFSDAAMQLLYEYDWPGNVRELENVLERTITLTPKNVIAPQDILLTHKIPKSVDTRAKIWPAQSLAKTEKMIILECLKSCSGNHKQTAEKLGISTTTLWRKLKSYKQNNGHDF